ncbi:MarR family transcriptional regulator, partial [Microbacterium sp. ISL-103]|nr:MarR family transcriptional regulator [Microbacterium sp. ISL-103]
MSASSDDPASTDDTVAATDGAAPPDLDEAVSRVEHELGRLFARIRVSWREAATTVHPDLPPLGYQVLTS